MHAFSELREDREERWCRDVFEELDKRGFPFGKMLANVKWDDVPRFLYIMKDRANNKQKSSKMSYQYTRKLRCTLDCQNIKLITMARQEMSQQW